MCDYKFARYTDHLLKTLGRVGCQLDLPTSRGRVDDDADSGQVHVGVHAKYHVDDELFGDVPVVGTDTTGRVQHEHDVHVAVAFVCRANTALLTKFQKNPSKIWKWVGGSRSRSGKNNWKTVPK